MVTFDTSTAELWDFEWANLIGILSLDLAQPLLAKMGVPPSFISPDMLLCTRSTVREHERAAGKDTGANGSPLTAQMIASHMESATLLVGIEESRPFWKWVTVTFAHAAQLRWVGYQLAFGDWCDELGDANLVRLYRDARAEKAAIDIGIAQIRHHPLSDWDAKAYKVCNFSNDEAKVIANNTSDDLPALTDPLSIIGSTIRLHGFQRLWTATVPRRGESEQSLLFVKAGGDRRLRPAKLTAELAYA